MWYRVSQTEFYFLSVEGVPCAILYVLSDTGNVWFSASYHNIIAPLQIGYRTYSRTTQSNEQFLYDLKYVLNSGLDL